MKIVLPSALLVAALVTAVPARAQVFGQFTGAATVPPDGHLFGAYLNASENVLGGLAQLRLSFYPNVDFGFQGGLSRLDPGGTIPTRTTLRLGTDVRWQVSQSSAAFPVDITVAAGLGVETADDFKVVSLGPSVVASRTLGVGSGDGIVPYAALSFLFRSRDAFGLEDTDLSLPLRLGAEARFSPAFSLAAELQLFIADSYNDHVGFAVGANLPF